MPFIRKSKLQAINNELSYLRNWKSVTEELEDRQTLKIVHLEDQAEMINDFLRFIGTAVPDYEGYVLQYMEEKDSENERKEG